MERIYRSRTEKKLAGICGGLVELLDIDPTIIRLATVFVAVLTAVVPVVVTYVIGWIIIPEEPYRPERTEGAQVV